jgi:hypothetical protein
VAENSLRASQNNTVSQSADLGRVALPKNPETAPTPANDLTEAKLAPLLSRAELKLQSELASLQQKAPDTVIEIKSAADISVAAAQAVETKTAETKESQVSYTTKKSGYGVAIPPLIRDPLGFLAALLKIFEKMLLGTLDELNTKPEMSAVQINIKKDQEIALEKEQAKEKEAQQRTENGIASDGSILAEARMSWSGNSDDDNQNSDKEK